MHPVALAVAALATASLGALGGLGGAVLLVPILVVAGVDPWLAAPLGLVSVAAGSLAAAPRQLTDRVVNHRLAVSTEIAGSAAALVGALISGLVAERVLSVMLGLVAIVAALAGASRKGVRNPPDPELTDADVGERPGTLAGVYPLGDAFVPYRARRVPVGMLGMAAAGIIAGLSGVSGGFVKTPVTTEVMHVPVKVAAATTTFTVGITSAVALAVFASQGRVIASDAALVAAASIVGGVLGARLQAVMSPPVVRRVLAVLLVVVGLVLLVRG
ncbi:sulfite exporter TauE/SafE family protein [Rhabdothermincola salaria]|uniref:sulfite exporter TauE/SafE family protein n=1 Tax=Rhabdothermincola salaria TaxID=2903142 RepID=UPI001E3429ED|nr:sulfite exporter TauE/SafE family protein [Rhabdothermincola salaria]